MQTKDTLINSRVGLYNQLGRIYRASNNATEAIRTFDNALQVANKLSDSVIVLNNKANIYKDLLDYKNALDIYSFLFEKRFDFANDYQTTLVTDNLGLVQSKLHIPEGLDNLKNALTLRQKNNDLIGQHASNTHLSEYYLDRKDTTKALFYAEKALSLSDKINSSSFKLESISLLMNMDKNPLIHEYKKLTDSK